MTKNYLDTRSEFTMIIKEDMMNDVNAMEDKIIEALGYEEAFLSVSKALDVDTKNDVYKYIMRNWDIPMDDEDEEFEFDGYEFDPYSNWTDIWDDVIQPIIESYQEHDYEYEDDLDAKINMFLDEYSDYPSVRLACEKFFDEQK